MQIRARNIPIFIILIVLVALWVLPVWTSMLLSTKSAEEYMRQTFYQLPTKFAFIDNFKEAMRTYSVHEHFFSSIFYSAFGAAIAIVFASMAGYSIVRLKPKFNFLLFLIFVSIIYKNKKSQVLLT